MARLGRQTNSKKKWVRALPSASVGAGSVIMAEPGSFDHYFLESLVLIIEHDPAVGSKGVLLNHETPWQVEEMSPGALPPFSANAVFLGGDAGKDTMIMIHGEPELPGAREVGRGVYMGGVASAVRAVEEGALPPDRFKFFYKTVEFLPDQLQAQVDSGIFRHVELSPFWLFGQSGQRAMWKEVREAMPYTEEGPDDEVTGAVAGPATGLPYEGGTPPPSPRASDALVDDAQKGVSKMRSEIDEHRRKRDAHDQKLKAYVAQLVADKEARLAAEAALAAPPAAPAAPLPTVEPAVPSAAYAAAPDAPDAPADRAEPPTAGDGAAAAGAESEAAAAAAWLRERGIVAPPGRVTAEAPRSAAPPEPRAAAPPAAAESAAGIAELVGYRVFLGNEQWQVRWRDSDAADTSWEKWELLDTDQLRAQAEALRAAAA